MQKTLSIIIAVFSISFYACNSKHSGGEVKIENDGPKWSSLGAKNNLKIGKQGWLEGKQENIDAFIVYKDELYVGGNFTNSFGLTGNYIAKWNGSKWSAVGNGVDGGVGALIIYNDELYVGGCFNKAGDIYSPSIAKWNGTKWSSVGDGLIGRSYFDDSLHNVDEFAVHNGELYMTGGFSRSGRKDERVYYDIAKWDGKTLSGLELAPNSNQSYGVHQPVSHNGELYFKFIYNWEKWNGTNWSVVANDINPESFFENKNEVDVNKVKYNIQNIKVKGDEFSIITRRDGATCDTIGRATTFNGLGQDTGGRIYHIIIYKGQLYIIGAFEKINEVPFCHIARLDITK